MLFRIKEYFKGGFDWKSGRVSGSVYYYDPELVNLVSEVYSKSSYTNPLHPDIFPGLCKMEAEVVRIAASLFHGGSQACGTVSFEIIIIKDL